jgi:hypothetical protein
MPSDDFDQTDSGRWRSLVELLASSKAQDARPRYKPRELWTEKERRAFRRRRWFRLALAVLERLVYVAVMAYFGIEGKP